MRNKEIKNEIHEIKKIDRKKKLKENILIMNKEYLYDFQQYEKVRSFGYNICRGKPNIEEAEMNQINLLKNIVVFINRSRRRTIEGKDKKRHTEERAYALY